MQPTLCTRCKKRVAVVFISKIEKGETVNEGLCLKCAKDLGLPQVNDMMRRMGITDDDLEAISDEMMQAFGGAEPMEGLIPHEDEEDSGEDGKTATFPFLNRLFGSSEAPSSSDRESRSRETKERKADKTPKRKYLDNYCINLTERARGGKLDSLVGRGAGDRAGDPDPQPPAEEQPLSHRRARRGQDRHCRGPGPANCQRRRPLQAAGQGGLSAGPDRFGGRDPVPRAV